jgi:hypothetical protein
MCKVQGAVKFGFLSSGSGSELLLGAGCQGIRNVANFAALNGGRLVVGEGSLARKSRRKDGFSAIGAGSVLQLGDGCMAVDNNKHGFTVRNGGRLVKGDQ